LQINAHLVVPTLANLCAAIVFSVQATETEFEREFSVSGRVATAQRASISPLYINQIICIRGWLRDSSENVTKDAARREENRAKRACRFATLSLKREIIPGDVGTDDSDSDDEEENDYAQALRLEGGGRSGLI
jgi:hAT family C-terminal dimerisation region